MPENISNQSFEDRLFKLLDSSSKNGIDQDNLLILLSLVNLTSIINIIEQRIGIAKGNKAENPIDNSLDKSLNFDPGMILNMLGGKNGFPVDSAQLTELMAHFMKPKSETVSNEDKPAPNISGA
ncbi:MAG: hypothetical protein AAGU75_17520 [Bacillota bacterium]